MIDVGIALRLRLKAVQGLGIDGDSVKRADLNSLMADSGSFYCDVRWKCPFKCNW